MNTVVYEWRREEGTPYYIGIGRPQRPYTGRRSCGPPPPADRIVILHEGLDWEKACEIERELIAFYGRKDLGTGILRNLTDGGEGVPNLSKSTREKISKANSGENNYNYGKTLPEETKAKISEALSGENHPMYGKNHKRETIEKMSGENHHMYGKTHSKETKVKMSKKQSGQNNARYTSRNWYHPVHGIVLQKSASDLIEMFPEQRLNPSHLSRVALKKRSHHRGWSIVKVLQGGK
jgi:hypothetical protein